MYECRRSGCSGSRRKKKNAKLRSFWEGPCQNRPSTIKREERERGPREVLKPRIRKCQKQCAQRVWDDTGGNWHQMHLSE